MIAYFCRRLILIGGIPLALSVLMNLPALQSSFIPTHDSFFCFSCFAIFAKHLRQFGEIPLWLPNSIYGMPPDYRQLVGLSPISWLFILISLIFRHADLLCLFKLSLILEQALFGASCAWLAHLLFRRFSVQIFFVISSMMSCDLWHQPFFNLRQMVPLPWIIGLMLLAFRRKSRLLLFASAGPILAAAYGLSFYFSAYLAILWLTGISISLVIHWKNELGWLIVWPKRRQLIHEFLLVVLLFVFAGAIGCHLLLAENGQTPMSPGRDPTTGLVSPSVYLSYGGVIDLATQVWSESVAWPDFAHNQEAYIYCGVPVMFAAVMGIFLARSRSSRLVKGMLFFTAAFSIAGFLPLLLYYLPLMNNFRHLGYTSVTVRFFLCLAAGFGMQSLLDSIFRKNLSSAPFIARIPLFIAISFVLFLPVPAIWSASAASAGRIEISEAYGFVIFSLVIGLSCGAAIWATARLPDNKMGTRLISIIMLGALILSAGKLTREIYERDAWNLSGPLVDHTRNVLNAPLSYVPARSPAGPDVEEFENALSKRGVVYDVTASMLNYDYPLSGERSDIVPTGTFRLIQLSQSSPDTYRSLTMQGQPKAYLADHPTAVITNQVKPAPGDVYLESDQGPFILKRNDDLTIAVKEFSFNHVTFDIPAQNDTTMRRFLVYQDAWHPEWMAMAGKKSFKIWPVNIAFKAVEIQPEVSQITFRFGSAQRYVLAWLNALLALAVLPIELASLVFLSRDRWLR